MFQKLRHIANKARPKPKLKPQALPSATTLMTLPLELRQLILLHTYSDLEFLNQNRYIDGMLMRRKHLESWILALRKVHPEIDAEMDFVAEIWRGYLKEVQDNMRAEFQYIWKNLIWKDEDDLTPQQVRWARDYRRQMMELGARVWRLSWDSKHPVLKRVRKILGLRRWIGFDDRAKMLWRHEWWFLEVAWVIMDGSIDNSSPMNL